MDAWGEALVGTTTVVYCMLMKGGLGDPAVSLMLSSRWSYTGTHHLSSSFTSLQSDFYAAPIVERIYE